MFSRLVIQVKVMVVSSRRHCAIFSRPFGTCTMMYLSPALKRRAIVGSSLRDNARIDALAAFGAKFVSVEQGQAGSLYYFSEGLHRVFDIGSRMCERKGRR